MITTTSIHSSSQECSIAATVLKYAEHHLQASPQILQLLQSGLCYGVASSALAYHALGRFECFATALQLLRHPQSIATNSSRLGREVIETVFYLQSVELQANVQSTSVLEQRFSAQALLTLDSAVEFGAKERIY